MNNQSTEDKTEAPCPLMMMDALGSQLPRSDQEQRRYQGGQRPFLINRTEQYFSQINSSS